MRIQIVIGALLSAVVFSAGVVSPGLGEVKDRDLCFRFGWPVGTTGSVETTVEKQKAVEGQQPQNIKWTAKFRMRVEKAEKGGIEVRIDAQDGGVAMTEDGSPVPIQDSLAAFLQTMDPTMILDDKGRFLAIKGIDRIQDAMKKALSELMGGTQLPPDAQRLIQQFLDTVMSSQALTVAAERNWNALVGFWDGQRLEPGEVYESKGQAPLPLPGAPTVEMLSLIEVEGPFPCSSGQNKPLCARIKTSTRFDEVAVRDALDGFMKQATKAAGASLQFRIRDFDLSTVSTLTTEINTLLPHDYHTEKSVRTTVIDSNGNEQKASQKERRHSVYTY